MWDVWLFWCGMRWGMCVGYATAKGDGRVDVGYTTNHNVKGKPAALTSY